MVTAVFAIAHQDWRRAVLAVALLAAALLVWRAARPVGSPRPATRRAPAVRPGCTHPAAMPVTSTVTGQTLAALCPACDTQLPTSVLTSSAAYAGLRADTAAIHGILTDLVGGLRGSGVLDCPHHQTIDVTAMGDRHQRRQCLDCGATWAEASSCWPAGMF
ncbi:hypothetical protein B1L11_06625 [Microbispora sp. GKU 823]|nr:hypothetical protein B1L11_06625 [Microbispora sp. GKU 823]